MTIATITIGGNDYTAYASVAEADIYLAVDPVRATQWASLTTDQKGSYLISATRRLDFLQWDGEKTGGHTQENAWPRTGLQYPDGEDVATDEVPLEVENACILLAGSIAINATAAASSSSSSKVKSIRTLSTSITYFSTSVSSTTPLQDDDAYNLAKIFLAVANVYSTSYGNYASGTDGESTFADLDRNGLSEGYP